MEPFQRGSSRSTGDESIQTRRHINFPHQGNACTWYYWSPEGGSGAAAKNAAHSKAYTTTNHKQTNTPKQTTT